MTMTALVCMTDASSNTIMAEMLAEAGIRPVLCTGEDTDGIVSQFTAVGADVLVYDPGLPYKDTCEYMVKLLTKKMVGLPVLFASVSADVWGEFLAKNDIKSRIINPYDHGEMYKEFFGGAVREAHRVAGTRFDINGTVYALKDSDQANAADVIRLPNGRGYITITWKESFPPQIDTIRPYSDRVSGVVYDAVLVP